MRDDRLAEIQAAYTKSIACIDGSDINLLANAKEYIRDCLAHIDCCHTREQRLEAAHEAALKLAFNEGFREGAIKQYEERE